MLWIIVGANGDALLRPDGFAGVPPRRGGDGDRTVGHAVRGREVRLGAGGQ
jgi:hypothetical protein